MKRLLFSLFFVIVPSIIAFAQPKRVAVYVIGEDAGMNKVLGTKLQTAIARSEGYSAVERTAEFLAELSKEQKYQRTGAVDDSDISRLGKQFGVQYVCVATVSEAFSEKYISARLIDVESAQVEGTASSSGAIRSLPDIMEAANTVSYDLLSSLRNDEGSNLKRVAVYIVKNDAAKNIGRVLGDKLVAGFTSSGRYVAIERTNAFLDQLSKEQKYQRTGAVDDSDISRLGKQFGVQYVCVADVSDVLGQKYISARLIDVETAEIVNSRDVGGSINRMDDCINFAIDIASNLSKGTFAEQAGQQSAEEQRKIEEERIAEQRRKEAAERAEKEKIEALKKRNWWNLLSSRITKVNSKWENNEWYVGQKGEKGRNGLGLYHWDDGTIYIGNYKDGHREGTGIYQVAGSDIIKNCPNGKNYVGEWKNDEKHGVGTVYDKDGKLIYYGKFKDGKPIEVYPSQGSYTAYTFRVFNYNNGNKYWGELKNGLRHGKGVYIWNEGNSIAWYGTWHDDERDGYGILFSGEGTTLSTGIWKGDTKQ